MADIDVSTQSPEAMLPECVRLYNEMKLHDIVCFKAFQQAMEGFNKVECSKPVLTLIDFTKPSTEERLYVFDMKMKKLLYSAHVSHGRHSGSNFATSFSNKEGSYKSSLGFFVTENTYVGRNGYSLILDGLEKGINDKAKERAIVVHGAPYSNPEFISGTGRLGRSQGCPALPTVLSKPIINTIKEGSLLYIYAADDNYEKISPILSDAKNTGLV